MVMVMVVVMVMVMVIIMVMVMVVVMVMVMVVVVVMVMVMVVHQSLSSPECLGDAILWACLVTSMLLCGWLCVGRWCLQSLHCVLHSSWQASPFLVTVPRPCLPIPCSYPFAVCPHFCIHVSHQDGDFLLISLLLYSFHSLIEFLFLFFLCFVGWCLALEDMMWISSRFGKII